MEVVECSPAYFKTGTDEDDWIQIGVFARLNDNKYLCRVESCDCDMILKGVKYDVGAIVIIDESLISCVYHKRPISKRFYE